MHDFRPMTIALSFAVAGLLSLSVCQVHGEERTIKFAQNGHPPGTAPLKVDVNLVVVNATVTDLNFRFVTGLENENFQIYEDNVPQKISQFSNEDAPASIGLLFDVSGSMKDKIAQARQAAVAFLKTSNQEDEYFLMTFADRPAIETDFVSDIGEIQDRLAFKVPKGSTTLYDAVYPALNKIKQGSNPKKAIVLITDGDDTASRYSLGAVRKAVQESDCQIFAIGIELPGEYGFGEGYQGIEALKEMAESTGGSAYFPSSVYDLEDICEKIAIGLKNEYVLGYSSTNPSKDGRWRKIKIKLHAPKGLPPLSVRARHGYFAPTG